MTFGLHYDLIPGCTLNFSWGGGCNCGIFSRLGCAIAPLHPLATGLNLPFTIAEYQVAITLYQATSVTVRDSTNKSHQLTSILR